MRIVQDFPSGLCVVFEYDNKTGKRVKFEMYDAYGNLSTVGFTSP